MKKRRLTCRHPILGENGFGIVVPQRRIAFHTGRVRSSHNHCTSLTPVLVIADWMQEDGERVPYFRSRIGDSLPPCIVYRYVGVRWSVVPSIDGCRGANRPPCDARGKRGTQGGLLGHECVVIGNVGTCGVPKPCGNERQLILFSWIEVRRQDDVGSGGPRAAGARSPCSLRRPRATAPLAQSPQEAPRRSRRALRVVAPTTRGGRPWKIVSPLASVQKNS